MRYYFDLREGDDVAVDEEGAEFPTLEAAQEEAALSLASMARDAVRKITNSNGQRMEVDVRDARGLVFQLKFAFDLTKLR
jgi:hypothetical protein